MLRWCEDLHIFSMLAFPVDSLSDSDNSIPWHTMYWWVWYRLTDSWNLWSLPWILSNRHKKSYLRFSKFGCWSWDRKFLWNKKHVLKMDPSCSLSKGFASHGYTWQIAQTHTMKTSIIVEFWNVAKHAPNPSTLLWDWQIFLYDYCHFVCLVLEVRTYRYWKPHVTRNK